MKTGTTYSPPGIGRSLLGALALMVLVAFGSPQAVEAAGTAVNSKIINIVTVTYRNATADAASEVTAEAASIVTVTLKEAALDITDPADDSIASEASTFYTHRITSRANGSDTYTLENITAADADGDVLNAAVTGWQFYRYNDGSTTVGSAGATSLSLGASIITGVSGATISVPGGTFASSGLEDGDVVEIDGTLFKIDSHTTGTAADHTYADGNAHDDTGTETEESYDTITLSALTAAEGGTDADPDGHSTLAVGTPIYESAWLRVTVTGDSSTVSSGTQEFDYTVTMYPDGDDSLDTAVNVITTVDVVTPELTIQKLVRNVSATPSTFAATANGQPGDILEYQVIVTATGTSGDAHMVTVTDAVPRYTKLLSFATSSYGTSGSDDHSGDIFAFDDTNDVELSVATGDENAGNVSGEAPDGSDEGDALNFYIGAGQDGSDRTGGILEAGETITILYQVKID